MPDRPTADPMQAMMKAVREVNESRVCESPDAVCAMGSPFRGNKKAALKADVEFGGA